MYELEETVLSGRWVAEKAARSSGVLLSTRV
jgi:hypothetical protein